MKNLLTKTSCLAGAALLLIGTSTAFSQGCNPGYGGYQGGGYYQSVPSSNYGYNGGDYDSYGPGQYSQSYTGNYYRSGASDQCCPPQRSQAYSNSNGACQCAECVGGSGTVNYSSRGDESINARLSYIESILTFILSHLGFDDKFSQPNSQGSSRVIPQSNQSAPAGDCAGGT